ncbi:MAG TPA: hypothetical protein VFH48_34975 [Chloroflexota bacterium]|nr:hypothetical protein [Chloroflexota bacterium]
MSGGLLLLPVEYETKVVGVAGLAKGMLEQLGVAAAIAEALPSQPRTGATYGRLAEGVIVNRADDRLPQEPGPDPPDVAALAQRIAGLTLLIMLAVLLAALVEHQVRAWIARPSPRVHGVLPDQRDSARPTAKALLRTFHDDALILIHLADGSTLVHLPKLRPVQHQIWAIMGLPPLLLDPIRAESGK